MSQEEVNRLIIQTQGIEKTLQDVLTALQGNGLGAEGVLQHMQRFSERLEALETDVKSLKSDRTSVKGWIAGLSAAGGLGGILGSIFG
jgi:chaperonin cofactor prefoldin